MDEGVIGYIQEVYVMSKDMRGKGIGTWAVQKVLQHRWFQVNFVSAQIIKNETYRTHNEGVSSNLLLADDASPIRVSRMLRT